MDAFRGACEGSSWCESGGKCLHRSCLFHPFDKDFAMLVSTTQCQAVPPANERQRYPQSPGLRTSREQVEDIHAYPGLWTLREQARSLVMLELSNVFKLDGALLVAESCNTL